MRIVVPACFFLLGFGLLGVAAGDYFGLIKIDNFWPREKTPYIEVSQTDIEVKECAPVSETPVIVKLKNQSSHPVRVVGLANC